MQLEELSKIIAIYINFELIIILALTKLISLSYSKSLLTSKITNRVLNKSAE